MKRKIGELILIIFFYLLQVTLGRVIAIGGIKPNLLIILPVLFGFLHGKNEGMYVGFFAGFFYEISDYFPGDHQSCRSRHKRNTPGNRSFGCSLYLLRMSRLYGNFF